MERARHEEHTVAVDSRICVPRLRLGFELASVVLARLARPTCRSFHRSGPGRTAVRGTGRCRRVAVSASTLEDCKRTRQDRALRRYSIPIPIPLHRAIRSITSQRPTLFRSEPHLRRFNLSINQSFPPPILVIWNTSRASRVPLLSLSSQSPDSRKRPPKSKPSRSYSAGCLAPLTSCLQTRTRPREESSIILRKHRPKASVDHLGLFLDHTGVHTIRTARTILE